MGKRATDMKYKASGPLADIIGTRSMKRGAVIKKVWNYIKKEDLQGVSGSGDTVKYKRKTYLTSPCDRKKSSCNGYFAWGFS